MTHSAIDTHLQSTRKPQFDAGQLSEITKNVFSTMLELNLFSLSLMQNSHEGFPQWVHASIVIDGSLSSKAIVAAPISLAQTIACSMFSMNKDELTNIEVADAMGEVINVIGGNLLALTTAPCKLALPTVSNETTALSIESNPTNFECEGMPFQVVVNLLHQ